MTVGRSPNYPRIALEEGIEKIKIVYQKQHTYPTDKEVLAKNLGYGGINGGSQSMVAALLSYGLLSKVDNNLKVSDEAVSVIELPDDSPVRFETIQQLATTPFIFANLEETYRDKLPQNELIRHFLIKKGFLSKAADEVIRIYHANLEFVNTLKAKYNTRMSSTPQSSETSAQQPVFVLPQKFYGGGQPLPTQAQLFGDMSETSELTNSNQELKFRLSSDSDVKLMFRGDVTQEAVTKLIKLLELSMDTFPSQQDLKIASSTIPRLNKKEEPALSEESLENAFDFID